MIAGIDLEQLEGELLDLRYIPLDAALGLLWADNAKRHDMGGVAESIEKNGFRDPPSFDVNLVNVNGEAGALVEGNGRPQALAWMRKQQRPVPRGIPVHKESGEWFLPVLFGLDAKSQTAAARYAIDHNNLTMAGGDFTAADMARMWDSQKYLELNQLLANAGDSPATLDPEDLQGLLEYEAAQQAGNGEPPGDPEAALKRAQEWRDEWQVERGQLWQIGRHRVLCGDSYSQADIDRLLDGASPDMLHTDPPYGINAVSKKNSPAAVKGKSAHISGVSAFGSTSGTERKSGVAFGLAGIPSKNKIIQSNLYPVIEGDDHPFDPTPLLGLAPIVILWGANYYADKLPISSGWVVWDKREDITRNSFADCELAWSNQSKPARLFHHLWNGLHKGSQHGERRYHPTEKPTQLFYSVGEMFCPEGLWLDLFAGAGGQVVAAQRLGTATCYALEYEPLYVATILHRLSELGLEPELITS